MSLLRSQLFLMSICLILLSDCNDGTVDKQPKKTEESKVSPAAEAIPVTTEYIVLIVDAKVCRMLSDHCLKYENIKTMSTPIEVSSLISEDEIYMHLDNFIKKLKYEHHIGFELKGRDYKKFKSYRDASDYANGL